MTTTRAGTDDGTRSSAPIRNRQQEIFDAAARIFHERGYEATSIQDVAEAVGILKGSLYYYIDSKEDLLFGVIEDAHQGSLGNLKRWQEMEGDALTKLRAFISGHVLHNIENRIKIGVFFQDFRSLSPERREVIVRERDQYDHFLRELIVQGQEEGVVAPEVDPKLTAFAILGMMNWTHQWYQPGGPAQPMEIANAFADLVLGGIAAEGSWNPDRSAIGTLPESFGFPPVDRSYRAPAKGRRKRRR